MHRFFADQNGAIAVIFAVISIPFIALAGWGMDYVRLFDVRDHMQSQADAAVLNAMIEDADPDGWRPVLVAELQRHYGANGWASAIDVDGSWISGSDFRVTASASVPLAFMSILPGIPETQEVRVQATGRLVEPEYIYEPPEIADLDPEAGDFNRVWLYCYWPLRSENDPDGPRRTQMVPIADNGGSDFDVELTAPPNDNSLRNEFNRVLQDYATGLDGRREGIYRIRSGANTSNRTYVYLMPRCPSGSYMSYRLENVRFERTNQARWDQGGERYNYYTDTVIAAGGPETYDDLTHPNSGQPVSILETVLCETRDQCRPQSQGGIIPSGKNRTPQQAASGCSPGQYMYYGWEDRPPGQPGPANDWQDYAWTDSDFDDIRIIIKCPTEVREGDRVARLVD